MIKLERLGLLIADLLPALIVHTWSHGSLFVTQQLCMMETIGARNPMWPLKIGKQAISELWSWYCFHTVLLGLIWKKAKLVIKLDLVRGLFWDLGWSPPLKSGHNRCMHLRISNTSTIIVAFIVLKDDIIQEIEHVEDRNFVLFPAVVFWRSHFTNLGLCWPHLLNS